MADFTAALMRRDMNRALGLLTDDVSFFYSNGTSVLGKEAFSAVMSVNWRIVENYRYSTLDPNWIAHSDTAAAVIYGFEWSGAARGEKVGGKGRATRVFRRTDTGWLLAHEHLSAGQWEP